MGDLGDFFHGVVVLYIKQRKLRRCRDNAAS